MDTLKIKSEFGNYTVVLKEIEVKGIAYILISDYIDLGKLLQEAKKIALSYKATKIYFSHADEVFSDFTLHVELHELIKEKDSYKSNKDIRFVPLTLANRNSFLEIINDAFKDITNSATWNNSDLMEAIEEQWDVGYITYKKQIVGVYEIDGSMLCTFAISPKYQGHGLGREALKKIITIMKKRVNLIITSDNKKAYDLYLATGFKFSRVVNRWYELNI